MSMIMMMEQDKNNEAMVTVGLLVLSCLGIAHTQQSAGTNQMVSNSKCATEDSSYTTRDAVISPAQADRET